MLMIGLTFHHVDDDALRAVVEQRLCEIGHLEPKQFPMTQREVNRGGKTCGIYFCVHGPRSVKLTAIYEMATHTLIFYGSDGTRRETARFPSRVANRPSREAASA